MSTIVLRDDWAEYSSMDFWASNNVWNKDNLRNGVDYSQTITIDESTFPSGTKLAWSWPSTFNPSIYSYPEVILGYKPWNNYGSLDFTSQIDDLKEFKIDYSLTLGGQTDNFNVAFELWLTDRAEGQAEDINTELMIWVHDGALDPAGNPVGLYDGETFDATVFVSPDHGDASGGSSVTWQYIALEASTDVLSGQIDVRDILFDLKEKGLLTGDEFVSGYELGAEVAAGSGSLEINSLSQTFSSFSIDAGSDTLVGTPDDDYMSAGDGNDLLTGGAGNDWLDGGPGSDNMRGGAGNDTYIVDSFADIVDESLTGSNGIDTVHSSISFSLADSAGVLGIFEYLTLLGSGNISGTGNNLNNVLTGNAGSNVLDGRGGDDNMRGLAGDDVYVVDDAGDIIDESLTGSTGTDTVQSSISFSLANSAGVLGTLENLTLLGSRNTSGTGNILDNVLTGNSGKNVLNGAAGADTMYGFAGNDTFYVDSADDTATELAGGGSDRVLSSVSYTLTAGSAIELLTTTNSLGAGALNLTGNAFAQTIRGNAGNNVLNGADGEDTLTGGDGSDTFVFNSSLKGATNIDRITDFWAPDDTIRLENEVFTALDATGSLSAAAFCVGKAARDADDRIIYNNRTGALSYDADGDGAGGAVQFATLNGGPTLSNADFFVV